ncbi:MAG TPA: efflux RND transporter permease subunit [Kofleriaceae bacterium]|nr:efflux RND transporter permease subunit [Kofleriaceae bacterium]
MRSAVAVAVVALAACGKHHERVVTPARDTVAITISTGFPGATATEIEQTVTTPLERLLGQVTNLTGLHSRTTAGRSLVIAEFPAGTDPFAASEAVMKAINDTSQLLPRELPSPPTFTRAARTGAVLRLTLGSSTLPLVEVARIARDVVAQKLEQVAGVGFVEVCGPDDETKITVDPVALAAAGKTIDDVRTEIVGSSMNTQVPVGTVATGSGADAAAFARLPTVRDTARVETGASGQSCIAFGRALRVAGLTVTPQVGADPLEVRERLEALLPKLSAQLPSDAYLDIWPRTRPIAFEIRVDHAMSPLRRIDVFERALAELHPVTRSLLQLGLADRDPDVADLRIVPPPEHADALEPDVVAAFEHHHLTVLDRHDHIVGFAGPDPAALHAQADALVKAFAREKGLRVVEQIGGADESQLTLEIDRDRASLLGVTASELATTVRALAPGGMWVTTTFSQTAQTRVMLAIDGQIPAVLDQLMIRSTTGALVPLSAVVRATQTREPAVIFHEGQSPWIGVRVAGPLDALDEALAKLPVPAGIRRDVREPD